MNNTSVNLVGARYGRMGLNGVLCICLIHGKSWYSALPNGMPLNLSPLVLIVTGNGFRLRRWINDVLLTWVMRIWV